MGRIEQRYAELKSQRYRIINGHEAALEVIDRAIIELQSRCRHKPFKTMSNGCTIYECNKCHKHLVEPRWSCE